MHVFCALSVALIFIVSIAVASAQEDTAPAWLKKDVGKWKAELKYFPNGPDGEPITFEATETNSLLGENWIVSDFAGEFGGMPFKSHGVYGFDARKNAMVGTWVDSANGFMSQYEGKKLDDADSFELIGQEIDPNTGELVEGRQVRTVKDDQTRIVISYQKPEGSDEFIKVMEMTLRKQPD
jgi:hypothetical protein